MFKLDSAEFKRGQTRIMQEIVEGMASICVEEADVDQVATDKTGRPRFYRLLVLDLNGILICRRYEKNLDLKPPEGAYRQGNFFVWLRPGLDSFIEYIFEHFDVAVWSSVMKHNIDPLAREVFGKYYDRLFFLADQSYCQRIGNEDTVKPIFRKNLDKVWAFSDLKGRYDAKNTLIIDDSDSKMLNNPKECHFNPGTWVVPDTPQLTPEQVKQQAALMPRGTIRQRLEEYVAQTEEHCKSLQDRYNNQS